MGEYLLKIHIIISTSSTATRSYHGRDTRAIQFFWAQKSLVCDLPLNRNKKYVYSKPSFETTWGPYLQSAVILGYLPTRALSFFEKVKRKKSRLPPHPVCHQDLGSFIFHASRGVMFCQCNGQ